MRVWLCALMSCSTCSKREKPTSLYTTALAPSCISACSLWVRSLPRFSRTTILSVSGRDIRRWWTMRASDSKSDAWPASISTVAAMLEAAATSMSARLSTMRQWPGTPRCPCTDACVATTSHWSTASISSRTTPRVRVPSVVKRPSATLSCRPKAV